MVRDNEMIMVGPKHKWVVAQKMILVCYDKQQTGVALKS